MIDNIWSLKIFTVRRYTINSLRISEKQGTVTSLELNDFLFLEKGLKSGALRVLILTETFVRFLGELSDRFVRSDPFPEEFVTNKN